jgi:hypothetical protein
MLRRWENGSCSLLSNARNPSFYITNTKTNIAPQTLTIVVGLGLAVGHHHTNVTAPITAANNVTTHDHGGINLALQIVRPTNVTLRPQHVHHPDYVISVARNTGQSVS